MSFFSHKTRINSKISLFKAFFSPKTYFRSVKIGITAGVFGILVLGSLFTYAQVTQSQRYIIETVHVFPERISNQGWKNVDQIAIQNLSDVALYQEFNQLNSAYIDIDAHRRKVQIIENKLQQSTDDEDDVQEAVRNGSGESIIFEFATTTSTTSTSSIIEEPQIQEEEMTHSVDNSQSAVIEENIQVDIDDSISEEVPPTTDNGQATGQSDSVDKSASEVGIKKATGLFSLAFISVKKLFPFTQETTTSTVPSSVALPQDSETEQETPLDQEGVDPVHIVASSSEEVLPPASVSEPQVASSSKNVSEEASEDSTPSTPSATSSANMGTSSDMLSDDAVSTSTIQATTTSIHDEDDVRGSDEIVKYVEPELCTDECIPYTITMSAFGLPIFDQTLRLGGGQLRVSFAAQRRASRDELQNLSVNYSFDEGEHWQSSGVVIIDDEASNSINGGFYLFSIPELTTPEDLDSLMIEIRYQDDPRALNGIYLESAWLELFTVRAPEIQETNLTELIGDDGYTEIPLSGDLLKTDEGDEIYFSNTDENNGETLIIKSDQVKYDGLTKSTTYFSVTNISKREDSFSLKAYFPTGVGEVTSLQQWNQNKPKKEVIPEYRPYSYYCEAGWEATRQPQTNSLEEISKLLFPGPADTGVAPQSTSIQVQNILQEDTVISQTGDASSTEASVQKSVDPAPLAPEEIVKIQQAQEQTLLQSDEISSPTTTLELSTEEMPIPEAENGESASSTAFQSVQRSFAYTQAISTSSFSVAEMTSDQENTDTAYEDEEFEENNYICRQTNIVRTCDAIEGDNTSCLMENVKVQEHEVVKYRGGWEPVRFAEGVAPDTRSFFKKTKDFLGFGPSVKEVPSMFESRVYSEDVYTIKPGETKYFKMDIEFPPLSSGEFWIEALGDKEYGLLDPYWSSQWKYRVPITLDNSAGTEDLVEHQIPITLTSAGLADFWANVNNDGSDVRFVAEVVGNEDGTWYDTSWDRRIPLVIQSSQVSTSLTDFPVYVDLSTLGSDFFNNVQSNGADIRITSDDGVTELPYELVSIDTSVQSGQLYFKAPTVSDLVDTTFYIYYGNAGVTGYSRTDVYGGENVWTNNYLAVYHLEEDQSGTGNVGVYKDSTANNYDGNDENASNLKTGKLGSGQEFGDTQTDYISIPPAVLNGETDVTQSWWHTTTQTGQQAIVSGATGPGSTGNNEYLTFFTGSTGFNFYNDTVTTGFTIANHADGAWHAFTVLRNDTANQVDLYVDGVADDQNPNSLNMTAISIGTNGLIIGQEQDVLGGGFSTAQNFEGSLDELRFSTGLRSSGWIGAEYTNQNTPNTFYATSSVELLQPTQYTELDFWLQYFNATTSEADVWVQIDSLPAGATTTIYMYYGNAGATTASNEFDTFSYSTTTDIYYVVENASTGNTIDVYSLIDNNVIQLDGGAQISLNKGESTSLTGYTGNSTISVLGPISATINAAGADTIVPVSFASTSFASPTNRNTSRYYIYSPFASSSVQTYVGGSVTPDEDFSVATGTLYTSNTDAGNNQAVIIESTEPVLAYHKELLRDSFVLYPATTEDLFGIDSNNTQVSTLTSNPNPTVYCSGGNTATVSGVTRGEEQGMNNCTQGSEGTGNAVRITGSLYPFMAIQQADSDGSESTTFLPQKEFATEYYIPTDSAYIAVACSPRFGVSTIEVQTNSGTTVESATCTPSGNLPGKAYFVNGGNGDTLAFTAGHKIVSTNGVPFYVIYEDDEASDNDETNVWGAVQARKFLKYPVSVTFGTQELTIDAEYNQLSYGWYTNTNAQTPTSTWPLGEGAFATEGIPITGQGAVNDEEVLRLRMSLQANNATGTASSSAFKLQYTASDSCSLNTNTWLDVGAIGSTTALFTGYDNSLVSDGSTLASTTLASSTVFATYEEENYSSRNPNVINPGEIAEWDWVIQAKAAAVNTNYCFRMVRSAGQELVTYTSYPELYTAGPPLQPTALVYFDNEKTAALSSVLEFVATDVAGDEIHYQVQIDDNFDFSSPVVDRNSLTHFLEFENLNTSGDKAPFDSGARIRFTSPTTLTASTTYWWRVRGKDPNGSNTNGEWSVPRSFTTDGSVSVSQWHQTTGDQFNTDTLSGLSTSTTAVSLVTSPATLTTSAIDFDDATVGNAWGEVSWNDTETSGTILYQVEYLNGSSWQLVPDSEIANNSVGNGTSPINILGLDTTIYNKIRIVSTLTGTTLSIEDITVKWGQRVNTPMLGDLFDNEQTADTTPTFTFTTTDPQSDDLEYEISYSTDYAFSASTTINSSSTPTDFVDITTPSDTNPYASGDTISYTVPAGSALSDATTYWWKVRAKDPNGANSWSPWSDADSFTVDTSTLVSTWFQTTKEQFEQGTFNGLKASTSGSVVVNDVVGEYGRATTTDNIWLEITTQNTYNNMVVVGSARYSGNPQPERTVRVRNKTANTFEIKVDDYTGAFSGGSTVVDYMVMEAGDWTILNGGAGTRVIAGTVSNVTDVKARTYTTSGSMPVSFIPAFSTAPVVLATVSTDNDSTWVFTHTDNGSSRLQEPTASTAGFSLARSFESAVHDPEDIDYIAMDIATGVNNGVQYDFLRTPDNVDSTAIAMNYNNTGFTNPPGVVIVNNIGEDGGDGGFAFIETATPGTATQFYPEIGEGGVGANAHTQEIVAAVAFEADSGTLLRDNTNTNLQGTVASEPIYFSDGSGPKFERFLFSETSAGNSTTSMQVQYLTSTSSWALIPDSQIPGNSTGTTTSPVNLKNVDVSTYDTIRLYGTLTCDGTNCPELHDWKVEWSEGVTISGTAKAYDRSTNVTSGTVAVAVNGVLQAGKTGTISAGTWSINNVTAFNGDVVTVWVDGAADPNEAVAVFVYDGVGDMTGVELYEQHLSLSADELATTTNALLSSYDNSVSGDEDIFFDVDANNDLRVCSLAGCALANLYVGTGNVYVPASTTAEVVSTYGFINDGTMQLDANTLKVGAFWTNNGSISVDTSSVVFTATTSTHWLSDVSGTLTFNNVTFGETSGTATWKTNSPYDINGDLAVTYGTFDRSSSTITVAGGIATAANGFWTGLASTTFDGSGTQFWSDANSTPQSIGDVEINGSVLTVSMSSDVRAQSMTIASGNTLNAGGANTLFISGDFTNNNIFTAQTGTIVVDGAGTSAIIDTGASSLYTLVASTTAGGSVAFAQSSMTLLGDFTIATGTVTFPSVSVSVGGSFANTGGTFAHNNSKIIFTGSGTETIEQNGTAFLNDFYDVSFTGSGAWSFVDTSATTSNDFDIQNGTVTLPSTRLTVGGLYSTSGSGAFIHNNGEVLFLITNGNTVLANGSSFNDVRIKTGGGSGVWYNNDWSYRKAVTISASAIDETLTDFPVYVDLADLGTAFFSNVKADGGDIRVTQSDGVTEVPREIVSLDTALETGEMYFKANSLSSTTNTTFYIYYGNSGVSDYLSTDTYGAQNVWSNGYVMASHLNDLTTSSVLNSANGTLNGSKSSANNPLEVTTGQIYEAQDNSGDHIDFGNIGAGASSITISGWFNADILTGSGDTNTYGYTIFSASASGGYTWLTAGGTGNGGSVSELRFCAFSSSALCNVASGSGLVPGEWFYVSATAVDGGPATVRVNGNQVLSFISDGGGSWNSGSTLGDLRPGRNIRFDGRLDEFQISNVIRSIGWQDATYLNQSTTTDFYSISTSESAFARTFSDTNVTILGNLIIESGEAVFPTGVLSVGGSFDNNGVFNANSGTVKFNSTAGAETIAAGTSTFATLVFDGVGGDFTLIEHATATAAASILNASAFTVNSGVILETQGAFTNAVGGASTTWAGATLKLSSGTDYAINSKTDSGDAYGTLLLTGDTDISMWNSTSTSYITNNTSSIYSQDHNGVDGLLYIFGDYRRESGTEHWSYGTDFDGIALTSTTSRQAQIYIENGASVIASSSVLSIVGTSTASTTIQSQSGTFTLQTQNATVTASYFEVTNTDINGFNLAASTTVTSFDNALFTIGTGVSAMTVDASTVDSNPASQFFNTDFVTAGGNVNVTLSGSPTSYWWFRDGDGNRYGETYDNADGDPGSIRWDDSSYTINISGVVYADDGSTPLGGPTCDGVTNVVRVVVNNGTYTDVVPCSGADGSYTLSNVAYVGDPNIIVYLDTNGGIQGSVLTKTPSASISNMDIYAHRVVIRHEDTTALSIADMAVYDEANDSDIRFSAATGTTDTLIVRPDTELYVFASSTFTPAGTVTLQSGGSGQTYDGTLHIGPAATFTGAGTTTYSVGGSILLEALASFVPASSTVVMTATTSGKSINAPSGITFNALTFTGVGGGWNMNTDIVLTADMQIATGTVTGTNDVTLQNGSIYGNGAVSFGNGTVTIEKTNTLGGVQPWTFNNLTLGSGSFVGTTTRAANATTTVGGVLTIGTAHYLDAGGSLWNLTGSGTVFVEDGTFIEGTSTVAYGGTTDATVLNTTYYNLSVDTPAGIPTITAPSTGLNITNNLRVGGAGTSVFNLTTNDPVVAIAGDVFIASNGTLIGSDSATTTVSGTWDNNGTFTSSGGLIDFDSTDPFTIQAGDSSFGDVRISAVGPATVSENATSSGSWFLSASSTFTVASGTRLAVGGLFTNTVGGASTTWSGSTLHLFGAGSYEINASSTIDAYNILSAASGTHVRMWNSDAVSYVTATGGSIYSMDHQNTDGALYIFGDYEQSSQTDYWSYATDFDGTSLSGGNERQANVYFESGATALYTGGGLTLLGSTTATTTLQNQGSGTYGLTFSGTSVVDWKYGKIRNIVPAGVVFTGTPTVQDFSYTDLQVETNAGTSITVGGSAIDASPAKNFTQNVFTYAGGVVGAVNVTATGTTVSSWRYTNTSGALAGEGFDNDPAGDPGYIVWDDSAALITISGNVYSDEGSTPSGVCDGVTPNILLRVAGLTTASTTCDAISGAYTITNVTFSANDTLTLYISGEAVQAANVSIDPISSISDMHLYENRVIVRHEGTDPITIADMSVWDSSDDADIPFTAVNAGTDTLTLPSNTKLIVWNNKEFAPAGNVTLSGGGAGAAYDGTLELYTGATYTAAGTEQHTVGGSLVLGTGATFTPAQSTVTFTTTGASRTIDLNSQALYDVTFNGAGSWTITDPLFEAEGDVLISAGTLTLPSGTSTIAGSFQNTAGAFIANGGTLYFTATTSGQLVAFGGSDAHRLQFDGVGGAWTITDTNATATDALSISNGSVTLPSGVLAVGADFINSDTIVHNNGTLKLTKTSGATALTLSGDDLYSLTIAGGATTTMTDASAALLGDLTVASGTIAVSTSTLSIAGSLDATAGVMQTASGTILFNSSDTGETVNMGSNVFYNATFGSASGGWTLQSATTTNNFTLSSASSFTLSSGATLSVGNVFLNTVGGTATTWTGSTLKLLAPTTYEINTKTAGGDVYHTLEILQNADISAWDSSFTTLTLASSSSFYSQDNAGTSGDLYIYGDYHVATSTEYWSYATDFDGTPLGGSSRAVHVYIDANASTTVDGGSLQIVGVAGATTTVQSILPTASYSFSVASGTLNAQYYDIQNTDTNGLYITGTPTISDLSNGNFLLTADTGSAITVTAEALNANASKLFSTVGFSASSTISGFNVELISGTTSSAWKFVNSYGDIDGEVYDSDGVTACGSVRWDDSSCLLVEQTHYRWRNDDGGLGVPDSEWFDTSWQKRKRVRITNPDTTAYSSTSVKISVTYDADMQADFEDLRFTKSDGVTEIPFWTERYTASTDAVVWLFIDSLPASDAVDVHMYYGNVTATSTASSNAVFLVSDDFEDGNITEYSGDTGLFTVDGSFAYGGSNGLDTTGFESSRATDGIGRTDQTVAQGQIIRYMQYIDTSAGSSDESCTLFGIQSVTGNTNYGVCLELFGTDRMTLAKNVESTDTYGNVSVLATTTVSYTTGWYEVEIDWQTDNTIDVALYTSAGSLVATTSATDSSYTSGGYGFTYWGQNGGWDSFTSRTRTDSKPTVKIGSEQVRSGATWNTAIDTVSTGFEVGDIARVRFSIENTGLAITNQLFQLEFADKGSAPSCEAVAASNYSIVPDQASCGVSGLCMATTTQYTDGTVIADLLEGTTGTYIDGYAVEDPSNTASALDIAQNEYTELEYAVTATTNANSDAYCLRVTNGGTDLDSYAAVAEYALAYDPVLGSVSFNQGNDISLVAGTTTRVYATTTVTDLNGYSDLLFATSTMYTASSTAACTADNNNCYIETTDSQCSFTDCSGNSCTLSCYADIYYHADATDVDGGNFWYSFLEVRDSVGGNDFATSPGIDVLTLRALDVTNVIDYGSLAPSSDTGTNNASTTIENLGNDAIDVQIIGSNLSDGYNSTIPVSEQIFATTTFDYTSCVTCTTLATSSINYEVDLSKPTTTNPPVTDDIYWGIAIPFGVAANPHTGYNTFYAIGD